MTSKLLYCAIWPNQFSYIQEKLSYFVWLWHGICSVDIFLDNTKLGWKINLNLTPGVCTNSRCTTQTTSMLVSKMAETPTNESNGEAFGRNKELPLWTIWTMFVTNDKRLVLGRDCFRPLRSEGGWKSGGGVVEGRVQRKGPINYSCWGERI